MTQTIKIHSIAESKEISPVGNLVRIDIGPDGLFYILHALKPMEYYSKDGSTPIIKPDKPQDYLVTVMRDGQIEDQIRIEQERYNIHGIQPLKDDLLLLCCRCRRHSEGDIDRNARIYSRKGELLESLTMGDGIERMQTTSRGVIWAGYFDEGMFGSFGWGDEPIGSPGLIAWDAGGKIIYQYEWSVDVPDFVCCWPVLDFNDDVWIKGYSECNLARIRDYKVESAWKAPKGIGRVAISGDLLLSQSTYDQDYLGVYRIQKDQIVTEVEDIRIVDENNEIIKSDRIAKRGDITFLESKGRLFIFRMKDVLSQVHP